MSLGYIIRAETGVSRPEADRSSLKLGRRQTRELPLCVWMVFCSSTRSVCPILSLAQQGGAKKMD